MTMLYHRATSIGCEKGNLPLSKDVKQDCKSSVSDSPETIPAMFPIHIYTK